MGKFHWHLGYELKKILLIDICGTITEKNTTLDFIRYMGLDVGRVKSFLGRLCWRFLRKDYLRKWYIRKLRGLTRTELNIYVKSYLEQLSYDREILSFINKYKNEYELYFASATLDIIASELAKKYNISGFYSSELEFINERCTGHLKSDLLDNKDAILSSLFSGDNYIIMISDNFGDYDVMRKCNESWAVVRKKTAVDYWKKKSISIIDRI